MAASTAPASAAEGLEGFLRGSGTSLMIDQDLWNVVNTWVEQVADDTFIQVLPLLRRTFANFSKPERRKLGEKVKSGSSGVVIKQTEIGIDSERAKQGIEVVMRMMGYSPQSKN